MLRSVLNEGSKICRP